MKNNLSEVIKSLKKEKPETLEDLLINCDLPLKFIGEGAFRQVFKIVGTKLVVKVPIPNECHCGNPECEGAGLEHALDEWKYRSRVMRSKKYEFVRPYIPTFHHIVRPSGIILTEEYKLIPQWQTKHDKEIHRVGEKMRELGLDGDIGVDKKDNWATDRYGKLRIIDLGCFGWPIGRE